MHAIIKARMFLSSSVLRPPGRRANLIMLSSFVNRALRDGGVAFGPRSRRPHRSRPLFSTNDVNTSNLRGTGENNCCMTYAALDVVNTPAIRAETVFAINAASLADGDEDRRLRTSVGVSGKEWSAALSCRGRILGEGKTPSAKLNFTDWCLVRVSGAVTPTLASKKTRRTHHPSGF